MNVPQYLLVEGFKQAFSIYTCTLHVAVPCKLQPRISWKKEGKASHFTLKQLGNSLTCVLQDCLDIPRLPEYSSLIVSTVTGKVTGNLTSVSGQTNAAGLGIIGQYFMNAPRYVLVKVQLMIRFETRFPLYTHGCAMFASTKLVDKREKGLLSSQFEQLG